MGVGPSHAQAALCIPLDVDTGWSNAAGALVNPLTAYSMVRMATQRGDKVRVRMRCQDPHSCGCGASLAVLPTLANSAGSRPPQSSGG